MISRLRHAQRLCDRPASRTIGGQVDDDYCNVASAISRPCRAHRPPLAPRTPDWHATSRRARFRRRQAAWLRRRSSPWKSLQGDRRSVPAGSPMMKSVFFESENLTQQCSGAAPATSTSAASIRLAISAFCSSLRPSNQWTWTKGMVPLRPLGERRLQLGLEATLGHRPDHLLGDRPVLEEDQGRDREDLVLSGGLLVLVDVDADDVAGRRARRPSPRGPDGRRGRGRTRGPRSRPARGPRPRGPRT